MQRCFARGARHAFITTGLKSNIAFVDCYSKDGHLSPEPHNRWTSAVLFDNVYSDSQFKLDGKTKPTVKHGQKAANCALWNCVSENYRHYEPEIWLNRPPANLAQNWVVGCLLRGSHVPAIKNTRGYGEDGYVESIDQNVIPRSLFMAQFIDRVNESSLAKIVTRNQLLSRQAVYDDMLGKYSSTFEFGDPDNIESWIPEIPSYNYAASEEK